MPAPASVPESGRKSEQRADKTKRNASRAILFQGSYAGGEVQVERLGYRGACTEPSITHHALATPHPNHRRSRFVSVCTNGM